MGGDQSRRVFVLRVDLLKSTPPVWAGTLLDQYLDKPYAILKSTPPVWAGTEKETVKNEQGEP